MFAVRLWADAQQSLFTNGYSSNLERSFMDVNLCRALKENAPQSRKVCRAYVRGARQRCTFAVRFMLAHGKGFLKINFSYHLLIFPPLVHYFALYIPIM
jgi:hypothetical protein